MVTIQDLLTGKIGKQITNYPNIPSIERVAIYKGINHYQINGMDLIKFNLQVVHLADGEVINNLTKYTEFLLDNTNQIPTGVLDENDNPVTIGDCDYFLYQAREGAAFHDMIEGGIDLVVAQGTLDAKCNY